MKFNSIFDYMDTFLYNSEFKNIVADPNEINNFSIDIIKKEVTISFNDGKIFTDKFSNIKCGESINACKYCSEEDRNSCEEYLQF